MIKLQGQDERNALRAAVINCHQLVQDLTESLRQCINAIDEEVTAADDNGFAHPLIEMHRKTAARARLVLARGIR